MTTNVRHSMDPGLSPEVRRWLEEVSIGLVWKEEDLVFRLYVAGEAPNSAQAVTNLKAIFDEYLQDRRQHLEVVDILEDPKRALSAGVLLTPTLVRLHPLPELKIVGNLSNRARVVAALGLSRKGA